MSVFEKTDDYDKALAYGDKYRFEDNKEKTPINNQFVKMAFNNINDAAWRIKHRSSLSGYLYIASRAIRKPGKYDKYDLYNRFYLDNKIASAPSIRTISKVFGYNTTSVVRKWVKELFEEGAFIIEQIDVGQPKPANVYVIGHFEAKKEIIYYGNIRGR